MTTSPDGGASHDPAQDSGHPRRTGWFRRRRNAWRRGGFDLKKALFILPNAFTLASIFCGFFAIVTALHAAGNPEEFRRAAMALFFAALFDAFDGRIARLTKTQSDFGVQMDSLADVISFGVAPALLVYAWALETLQYPFGLLIAFTYASCGTIRLARFNVLAQRGLGSSKYFVGLPIPGASTMLVSVIATQSVWIGESVQRVTSVIALVLVLSYLMVSRVPFRTFKDFRPSTKTAPVMLLGAGGIFYALMRLRAELTLTVIASIYISAGLIESIVTYLRSDPSAAPRASPDTAVTTVAASAAPPPVKPT